MALHIRIRYHYSAHLWRLLSNNFHTNNRDLKVIGQQDNKVLLSVEIQNQLNCVFWTIPFVHANQPNQPINTLIKDLWLIQLNKNQQQFKKLVRTEHLRCECNSASSEAFERGRFYFKFTIHICTNTMV